LTIGEWEYTIAAVFGIQNHSHKRVERSQISSNANYGSQD
jgi:hypothetical protein